MGKQWQTLPSWAPKSWAVDGDCSHEIKDACSLEEKLWTTWTAYLKAETLLYWQNPYRQSYSLSSSPVWMWGLGHKESWAPKNWFFWTVVLGKPLESHLDCKEIQPINPKGKRSWMFIGRTDAEAETPILWPPNTKNWLIGRDWCWERLNVGGEGDDRGWDGWMASPAQWTWDWTSSGSWWWTGKPGVLQSIGS